MCNRCEKRAINRRSLLALAGFGAAAVSLGLDVRSVVAAEGKKPALTPDQALAALKEGNARYVSSPQACVMDLAKRRADVATSQAPWAIIVGCSDSRVAPELLFGGVGPGELFVARNARNMVDTATMGTSSTEPSTSDHRSSSCSVTRAAVLWRPLAMLPPRTRSCRAPSAPWSSRSCRPPWP